MESIAVFDHLRLVDGELPPGVYRVVGTPAGDVTLLRVADAGGRRVHTGQVHTVPRIDLEGFALGENPDENRALTAMLASQLDGFAWQFRTMGRTVVARPILGTGSLALVAVGLFGDPFLAIPDRVDTMLFLAGALSLFYLPRTTDAR